MKYVKHFYVDSNFYLLGLGFESFKGLNIGPAPQ